MEKYNYIETNYPAKPRSKRLQEAGSTGASSIISLSGGSTIVDTDFDIFQGQGIRIDKQTADRASYTISHGYTSGIVNGENEEGVFVSNIEFDEFGHAQEVQTIRATDLFDERYLRKDVDDKAAGVISFTKEIRSTVFKDGYENGSGWMLADSGNAWMDGVQVRKHLLFGKRIGSPEFISGFPYGSGTDLSSYVRTNAAGVNETKWRLEIDDILVRGKLRAFEFVVSQLRGENDNVIFAGMMKVDHYDPETGTLWLQTNEGVLYIPFREGDILMMQRYGGLPSEGNQYNVIKQYELRVEEVGIGDLSGGKERLDWIRFSNFVGDLTDIAENDVLTRVDSVTDSTRKGIVKITTIDEVGAPNIDVVYGMKTNPGHSVKARLGNLTGIRTLNNRDLTGVWGLYAEGAVLENSQVYLNNGMTVEQNFTVMNGQFQSEINSVKDLVAAGEGNILKNPQFTKDTWYWENGNDVSVFRIGNAMLWFNQAYFSDKQKVADIYTDANRKVLRLKYTYIQQQEKWYNFGKDLQEEDLKAIYTIRFLYKALTPGTFKVGVAETELYKEIDLLPATEYATCTITAPWDGKGIFRMETTGEVLITNMTLYDDKLSGLEVRLQTQITQTDEKIQLLATKKYVDGADESIKVYMEGKFTVTAEEISASVSRIDKVENTIRTAGWITTADGNSLYARRDNVISTINQSPEKIKIYASKIELAGAITTSMLADDVDKLIREKASANDLKNYIPLEPTKGELEAAMKKEGLIVGGYIKMTLVNTDALFAKMAKIGGLGIKGNYLTNEDDENDAAIIIKNTLYRTYASIGAMLYAPETGKNAVARFENYRNANSDNCGIVVGVRGSQYDRNHAIRIEYGFISGFAIKPLRVTSDTWMTGDDGYVTCYNSSAIGVNLPSNPEPGRLVFVRKMYTASVIVHGYGKKIHNHSTNIVDSITLGSDGYGGMFYYDGQQWCYTYLLRNT